MIAKREKIDANERGGSPYSATTVTGATQTKLTNQITGK